MESLDNDAHTTISPPESPQVFQDKAHFLFIGCALGNGVVRGRDGPGDWISKFVQCRPRFDRAL